MRVVLVGSDPADGLQHALAARPARLAEGLRDLLVAAGHAVELVVLGPAGSCSPDEAAGGLADRTAAADVVHALDVAAAAVALRARGRTGVRTVVTALPAALACFSPTQRHRLTAVLRVADVVVVPSAADAAAARELGVGADRVRVVALAAAGEVPANPRLSTPCGDRLVSVLSGAHAWGGTLDVLAAVARLRGARLVVAGRCGVPDAEQRLRSHAADAGLGDRVEVTGWLSDAETSELVDRSAVVVAPRRALTTGAATLRAMGRARAVVAYATPVQADLVVDGETGLLVPVGSRAELTEAIASLLDDPFRQEAMGQAGQDRAVARFGAEPTLRAVQGAYGRTDADLVAS